MFCEMLRCHCLRIFCASDPLMYFTNTYIRSDQVGQRPSAALMLRMQRRGSLGAIVRPYRLIKADQMSSALFLTPSVSLADCTVGINVIDFRMSCCGCPLLARVNILIRWCKCILILRTGATYCTIMAIALNQCGVHKASRNFAVLRIQW